MRRDATFLCSRTAHTRKVLGGRAQYGIVASHLIQ